MQNSKIFQLETMTLRSSNQQERYNEDKSSIQPLNNSSFGKLDRIATPIKRKREDGYKVTTYKKPKLSSIPGSPVSDKDSIKPSLAELKNHYESVLEKSKNLKSNFGKKLLPIAEHTRNNTTWDYLLGEMEWMALYFEKERKAKIGNAKKLIKAYQQSLKLKKETQLKAEAEYSKLQSKTISKICKIVVKYWKAIEKIALHVGSLQLEEKRQISRSKRLDKLVDKHLELSSKVANRLIENQKSMIIVLKKEEEKWVLEDINETDVSKVSNERHKVLTRVPFMLKHNLREYQHIGLDWLVALHDKKLNGILADEMGLGKTIQSIALFAYLACERGIWGPHLVVVPTSIIINWEMELKKWCPGLKVLTYFGSQKERKQKRIGWSKFNSFNVCITSYKLVVQDQFAFKRKQWYYLVLDEAQHIKNFHSQRWQVLLKFNSKRRLLLSGTPLQNDVMELWSLLHFLMPSLFHSHKDFHAWFSSPFNTSIVQNTNFSMNIIQRLHSILRPFVLRRMKKDVEKQLPDKIEHIVFCNLSRRQQYLYDEFLERRYTQKEDCVGIMNILMQLRKVCNHPDLFAPREVVSPLYVAPIRYRVHSMVFLELGKWNFYCFVDREELGVVEFLRVMELIPTMSKIQSNGLMSDLPALKFLKYPKYDIKPVYGWRIIRTLNKSFYKGLWGTCKHRRHLLKTEKDRIESFHPIFFNFLKIQPKVETHSTILDLHHNSPVSQSLQEKNDMLYKYILPMTAMYHSILNSFHLLFPDRKSIEHDCGKLRKLSLLLSDLKKNGHKCVIFTQMAKMLDLLESFMNIHGYSYLRLDGSTRVEQRQRVVDIFNLDARIFCFISSTRSGGLGINLTGADVVIFYDTDWNPAMDKQAQDRCHRIGQTRNVHIYRLISSYTIEENILKKSMQKSHLDNLIMEGGQFTTMFLQSQKVKVKEFFDNINDNDLEEACKEVEDKEDLEALDTAKLEEIQDMTEFEEKQYRFLDQLEPVTKMFIDRYLQEHPIGGISSSGEETEHPDENSESEDMAIELIEGGNKIYTDYLQFLKDKYLVY